jgi:hypothetical protein
MDFNQIKVFNWRKLYLFPTEITIGIPKEFHYHLLLPTRKFQISHQNSAEENSSKMINDSCCKKQFAAKFFKNSDQRSR